MALLQIWQYMPGKVLLFLVNLVSAAALIFEGFNQGVYGTVSSTPGFIKMAQIGHDDVATDSIKQGGLAAAYYFVGMWDALSEARWVGDKFGRKKGTWFGIVGAALQAASQNSNMFLCARVIVGIGIGFMNAIILPWVSELSQSHDRGSIFSLVFRRQFSRHHHRLLDQFRGSQI
ncbi:hypothetical protein J3459_015928 [Metarhizium acridum]|nr:hypothetical protein J3459_015928 [Metarhizium acridum]